MLRRLPLLILLLALPLGLAADRHQTPAAPTIARFSASELSLGKGWYQAKLKLGETTLTCLRHQSSAGGQELTCNPDGIGFIPVRALAPVGDFGVIELTAPSGERRFCLDGGGSGLSCFAASAPLRKGQPGNIALTQIGGHFELAQAALKGASRQLCLREYNASGEPGGLGCVPSRGPYRGQAVEATGYTLSPRYGLLRVVAPSQTLLCLRSGSASQPHGLACVPQRKAWDLQPPTRLSVGALGHGYYALALSLDGQHPWLCVDFRGPKGTALTCLEGSG